jgi:hypothetical protein
MLKDKFDAHQMRFFVELVFFTLKPKSTTQNQILQILGVSTRNMFPLMFFRALCVCRYSLISDFIWIFCSDHNDFYSIR